jgi:hypothetical protein
MAPAKKTERSKLDIAEEMRQVVRMNIVVDEATGVSPLWSALPLSSQYEISEAVRSLAMQKQVDYADLRRKAQKYTQTLNERGRKVVKGELEPDLLQIAIACKKGKFVTVDYLERPRNDPKGRPPDPQNQLPIAAGCSSCQHTKPADLQPVVLPQPLQASGPPSSNPDSPSL